MKWHLFYALANCHTPTFRNDSWILLLVLSMSQSNFESYFNVKFLVMSLALGHLHFFTKSLSSLIQMSSPSLGFLCCIAKSLRNGGSVITATVSHFFYNFIYILFAFHFTLGSFAAFSYLLASSLSIIHFCKMSHGFLSLGDKEATPPHALLFRHKLSNRCAVTSHLQALKEVRC